MPDIIRGAPEPGTYRYVLARPEWPPLPYKYQVANGGETRWSRVVPWPEEWDLPVVRNSPNGPTREKPDTVMVFVQDRHLKDRLVRFRGWRDITDEWFELHAHPGKGPMPDIPVLDTLGEVIPV